MLIRFITNATFAQKSFLKFYANARRTRARFITLKLILDNRSNAKFEDICAGHRTLGTFIRANFKERILECIGVKDSLLSHIEFSILHYQ